jgi:hypothetical protein
MIFQIGEIPRMQHFKMEQNGMKSQRLTLRKPGSQQSSAADLIEGEAVPGESGRTGATRRKSACSTYK